MTAPPACLKRVLIWVPDYQASPGGIQTFSRFFVQAVADSLPDVQMGVMAKNDNANLQLGFGQAGRSFFRCAGWLPMPYRTFLYAGKLASACFKLKPDLVLTTHANFALLARVLGALIHVPYGVVAHGIEVWGVKKGSVWHGLRGASRIMAVSEFTRNQLVNETGLDPKTIGLLPNTFDSNIFKPAKKPPYLLRRYGLAPTQPVILTITRLAGAERYKGYDQIIQSLARLRARLPGIRYILGGRGRDRSRIERLAHDLGVRENLILTGYIPDHELEDHYNLCDVFSMPSKGEGFGIVYLEAMSCGKPVVAGNQDGSVDPLLNGQLGVLVNPDDVSAIGLELELILTRRHPLAILQNPGEIRQRVIEAFGYTRFAKCVADHLRALGFGHSPSV